MPGLFLTAPIPHTSPKPQTPPLASAPLTVSFLGAARADKGYNKLPGTIHALWDDYLKPNRIQFMIHAFSRSQNVSETAQTKQLLTIDPIRVRLLTDPAGPAEYDDLLAASDILLLPYVAKHIRIRTSGVCAEALARGIPVVVPGGTWLSRQFRRAVYEYHNSFGDSSPLATYAVDDWRHGLSGILPLGKPSSHLRIKVLFGNNGDSNATLYCTLRVMWLDPRGDVLVRSVHTLDRTDLPYATCLIPTVSGASKFLVSIHLPSTTWLPGVTLDLKRVEAVLLSEDPTAPQSVIGTIFDDADQIPACLKDMIDNYAHYRDTARSASDWYYEQNNAVALTKLLERTSDCRDLD